MLGLPPRFLMPFEPLSCKHFNDFTPCRNLTSDMELLGDANNDDCAIDYTACFIFI